MIITNTKTDTIDQIYPKNDMTLLPSLLTILLVGLLTFIVRKRNRDEIQRTTELNREIKRVLDKYKDI